MIVSLFASSRISVESKLELSRRLEKRSRSLKTTVRTTLSYLNESSFSISSIKSGKSSGGYWSIQVKPISSMMLEAVDFPAPEIPLISTNLFISKFSPYLLSLSKVTHSSQNRTCGFPAYGFSHQAWESVLSHIQMSLYILSLSIYLFHSQPNSVLE